jgi:hypothetical protein
MIAATGQTITGAVIAIMIVTMVTTVAPATMMEDLTGRADPIGLIAQTDQIAQKGLTAQIGPTDPIVATAADGAVIETAEAGATKIVADVLTEVAVT